MSDFDSVIEAQFSGATVIMALLIEVAFVSESYRLWTGVGTRGFGGEDWQGVGAIAEVSDVTRLQNGQADPFELRLVANDDLLRLALVEFAAEAKDQPLRVYMQFLNFDNDLALGDPWALRDGIMRGAFLVVDPETQALTIKCDTLSSGRNKPAHGMLNDRDQKARYPGDRGLEFVHTLNGTEVTWPDF